jgi:hypothetical protein
MANPTTRGTGRKRIKRGPGKRMVDGKSFWLADEVRYIQRRGPSRWSTSSVRLSARPPQVPEYHQPICRFPGQWLNVHTDFPLLQRIALPITVGAVRWRLDDTRDSRGRPHQLPSLRGRVRPQPTSLRSAQAQGTRTSEHDGTRYAYLLTRKGVQVALLLLFLLLLFFHKRLCGPLANSSFHHRPNPQHRPDSRLEPTTAPTTPSKRSSISWRQPDLSASQTAHLERNPTSASRIAGPSLLPDSTRLTSVFRS